MSNLSNSTYAADAAREGCLCVLQCEERCSHYGQWHNHVDEVCPLHPDTIVEV